MTDERDKLPNTTSGDTFHTLAKAGISAIPMLGGPAAELFAYLIVPPLTKRRDAWLQSLSDALRSLEEKVEGFSIESLAGNDRFFNILMEASHIAVRNHAVEKIEALRNAVLNAALQPPDEYLEGLLLKFLESATPWHIRVLSMYDSPKKYADEAGVSLEMGDYLSQVVGRIFPELESQEAFCHQIERDLLLYGLILSEGRWYTERTTETGKRVLALISSPLPK